MLPQLRHNNWDTKAPFSQWTKIQTFTNEKECRMHTIGAMQEYGYNTLRESAAQSGANVLFIDTRSYSIIEAQSMPASPPPTRD
jgi:hypothetical protein